MAKLFSCTSMTSLYGVTNYLVHDWIRMILFIKDWSHKEKMNSLITAQQSSNFESLDRGTFLCVCEKILRQCYLEL